MDNADNINQMFFADDQHTDRAKELQAKVEQFRDDAASLAIESGNEAMAADIRAKFNTDPVKTKDSGTLPWLNYNFEGFPLIAGITKLTNIQSNAKQVQSDLLGSLVSGQMASDVSMTNYEAIVVPDKTAFFSGENCTGKVVLGRFDSTLNFDEVTINGREVDVIQAGQVNLSFRAGNVGEHGIERELDLNAGDSFVSMPVTCKSTGFPKSTQAVICADKMSVGWRGVPTPMARSRPEASNATANAPGVTKTGRASYM